MSTLLLEFSGPLQSWGVSSRFNLRSTFKYPTKSGIVGLLAAAEGRPRTAPIGDLADLVMGVRADQPGTVLTDFQTEIDWRAVARGTAKNKASKPLTHRQYLEDAVFLVAIEGPTEKLEQLGAALTAPVYPLFLGRRSCPPARRVFKEINEKNLVDNLCTTPPVASKGYLSQQQKELHLRYIRDVQPEETPDELIRDVPVSFADGNRIHDTRGIIHKLTPPLRNPYGVDSTAHNPFAAIEGN